MARREKLLSKAKNSAHNLRFEDLCTLAECYGFVLRGQKGSHCFYEHPSYPHEMNFQSKKGKAKAYQVRQLLDAIEEIGEDSVEEDANTSEDESEESAEE